MRPTDIDGNYISGFYIDSSGGRHGFVYDISTDTYTTVDAPLGANGTSLNGISGNNIVGVYNDIDGIQNAFEAIPTPEPSILALAALGVVGLLLFQRPLSRIL